MQNKCLRIIHGEKAWPGAIKERKYNRLLMFRKRQQLNLLKYGGKRSLVSAFTYRRRFAFASKAKLSKAKFCALHYYHIQNYLA